MLDRQFTDSETGKPQALRPAQSCRSGKTFRQTAPILSRVNCYGRPKRAPCRARKPRRIAYASRVVQPQTSNNRRKPIEIGRPETTTPGLTRVPSGSLCSGSCSRICLDHRIAARRQRKSGVAAFPIANIGQVFLWNVGDRSFVERRPDWLYGTRRVEE